MATISYGSAYSGSPTTIYNTLIADFSAALSSRNYLNYFKVQSASSSELTATNLASNFSYTFKGSFSYSGGLPLGSSSVTGISVKNAASVPLVSVTGLPYTISDIANATLAGFTSTFNSLPWDVSGSAGNDSFQVGSASSSFDGGAGIDTATYLGTRDSFTASKTEGGFTVTSKTNASVTSNLTNVERLKFSDVTVALDISGNAGTTAKILGAVFGKNTVTNKDYAGVGLDLLDRGMSYADLMKLAINVKLGAGASNAAVVDLLYTNVVGSPPPASEKAFYVRLLDSGAYTVGTLGVLAADTGQNAANVNLVGLATSGLEYSPQG